MVFGVLWINSPRQKTTTLYADFHHHSHYHNPLQSSQVFTELPTYHDHHFPQIIFFLLPCILKFWVKGVQNKNIFDWRIHYPQCLSNLEAIGRKHFVKALPSEYSSSSTLRIFFSALPIFLIIFPQNIHLCPLNILLYWENHGVFIFHDDACPINRGFSSLWLVEELSNNERACINTARMYKYCENV